MRIKVLIVLVAAAAIPYFINLGASSLWDANEAFYAQTAREMVETADYVNPSFNFQLRYNKPVLSYWEVAAAYRLFGVSEWSERLPIAIGAIVLIATAFGLGRLIGGAEAGLMAALVLATSPRMLLLGRRIIIDVHVAMFTGLVLLCFALAETRPQRRRYLIAMYVAAGLGVLTKGPVAVFLPALVFFIYLAFGRRLASLRRMMLPTGAAVSLAIVLPWYVLVYRQHGWDYIKSFVFGENLGRYAEAVGGQARGIFFYIPVMFADLFPWSLFIPLALWWGVREQDPERSSRIPLLLLIWIAATVAFFSLSGTKEDLYILPIVPAEAALIGALVVKSTSPVRWFSMATGAVLCVAGAATFWIFAVAHRYSLQGAAFSGAIAAIGGIGALVAGARRRNVGAAMIVAGALTIVSWCVVLRTLPDFERYKPVRPFSAIVRSRASPGAIVGYYKFALPSMVYYLNRPIMEVLLPDHLRAVFSSSSDIYFVMPEDEYDSVKNRLPVKTFVLARQQMFDLRPMNFLHDSELPEFVLISNRPGDGAAQ
jgi:4-amino-4-deoxy-L-arabinose transferase-like glycosyltransferase